MWYVMPKLEACPERVTRGQQSQFMAKLWKALWTDCHPRTMYLLFLQEQIKGIIILLHPGHNMTRHPWLSGMAWIFLQGF
jgi:hypothetical protein